MADELKDETTQQPENEWPNPESIPEEEDAGAEKEKQGEEWEEEFLGRADSYGLSKDDLSGVNRAAAERMMSAFDRQLLATGRGQSNQQVQAAPTQRAAMPEFKIELDPEAVGEPVIKTFQGMHQHYSTQLQNAVASQEQMAQAINGLTTMLQVQQMDNFINSLGEEWSDVYGKGSTLDLNRNSREFKNRQAMYEQSMSLGDIYSQRFGKQLSVGEIYRRTHGSLHADKVREKQLAELNGKLKKRSAQTTERAGNKGSRSDTVSREEQIKKLARGLQRVNG